MKAAKRLQANFRGFLARRDLQIERMGGKGKGWGRLNRASAEAMDFLGVKKKKNKKKAGGGWTTGGPDAASMGAGGAFGGGAGGGAFGNIDFAAIVKQAVAVNKMHKMLIDTGRRHALKY